MDHGHEDYNNQQQHQQPSNMYQNPRSHQHEDYYSNNESNGSQQNLPVNELTARLENQLNMKSFSSSRVKSHM